MSDATDAQVQHIDQVRDRLASSVDQLVESVRPQNIARRMGESIKLKFVDETGSVRTEVVLPIVAGVAAVVAGAVVVRRILR